MESQFTITQSQPMFMLKRLQYTSDGILGEMTSGNFKMATLEHAYWIKHRFIPKVPEGNYLCKKGIHRLEKMRESFTTYEIQNVPRCTGILFHWGNWNWDSQGCILLGQEIKKVRGTPMITNSKETFELFMKQVGHLDLFDICIL